MVKDLWLPYGYSLDDNRVIDLLYYGRGWQVLKMSNASKVLLVSKELGQKYIKSSLLDPSVLREVRFGENVFYALITDETFLLCPISSNRSPESKVEAVAFALSIKETRKCIHNTSLFDGIYVEKYSRILPTYSDIDITDEVLLGVWLTGGVHISARKIDLLSPLLISMNTKELVEVVKAAGLDIPDKYMTDNLGREPQILAPLNTRKTKFTLTGRPQLEKFFQEHIIDILFNEEKYKKFGITFPSAIILHGPPGCGKTFAVEKLAKYIDLPTYYITSSSIGSPFIHETSKKIGELFDKAIETAPSILVIDEMEAFLPDRTANTSSSHQVEEVAEFLRRIPEAIVNKVLVIAMTNLIDKIDSAILRKGRFDHIIAIEMPSREEVEVLFLELFSCLPVATNLNYEEAINYFVGKPLSDITFFVRETSRLSVKNAKEFIDQETINSALANINPNPQKTSQRKIGFV